MVSFFNHQARPVEGGGKWVKSENQTFDLIITLQMMNRTPNFVWNILIQLISCLPYPPFTLLVYFAFAIYLVEEGELCDGFFWLSQIDPTLCFETVTTSRIIIVWKGDFLYCCFVSCFWLFRGKIKTDETVWTCLNVPSFGKKRNYKPCVHL
jgi:hypothetical protein